MSDDDPDGVRTRAGHRSTVYLPDGVYERWKQTGIPIGQALSQWLDVMDTLRDAGYPLDRRDLTWRRRSVRCWQTVGLYSLGLRSLDDRYARRVPARRSRPIIPVTARAGPLVLRG